MENKFFEVSYSKAGLPCLRECGGGMTRSGWCRLIGDKDGNPKKPIHIFTHGDLCCGAHAVIPVRIGDVVLEIDKGLDTCQSNKTTLHIYRLVRFNGDTVEAEEIAVSPEHFSMIEAGYAKCADYHCRMPYFIRG